jgi:hypothetical protein
MGATMTAVAPRFASQIDAFAFGEHRLTTSSANQRQTRQFSGRITADGSSGLQAEPDRAGRAALS